MIELGCLSCLHSIHRGALWCQVLGRSCGRRCELFVYEPGTDE